MRKNGKDMAALVDLITPRMITQDSWINVNKCIRHVRTYNMDEEERNESTHMQYTTLNIK